MKSSRVIIIIVLLLLIFGGFSGWQYAHRRIYRELQAVERVMGAHPDSALSLLRKNFFSRPSSWQEPCILCPSSYSGLL